MMLERTPRPMPKRRLIKKNNQNLAKKEAKILRPGNKIANLGPMKKTVKPKTKKVATAAMPPEIAP